MRVTIFSVILVSLIIVIVCGMSLAQGQELYNWKWKLEAETLSVKQIFGDEGLVYSVDVKAGKVFTRHLSESEWSGPNPIVKSEIDEQKNIFLTTEATVQNPFHLAIPSQTSMDQTLLKLSEKFSQTELKLLSRVKGSNTLIYATGRLTFVLRVGPAGSSTFPLWNGIILE